MTGNLALLTINVSKIKPPTTAATIVKKTTGLASMVSHGAPSSRVNIIKNSTIFTNQPPRTAPTKPAKGNLEPISMLKAVMPVKMNTAEPPAKAAQIPETPATKNPTMDPTREIPNTKNKPKLRTRVITDFTSSNTTNSPSLVFLHCRPGCVNQRS